MPTLWDHLLAFAIGVGLPFLAIRQHQGSRLSEPRQFTSKERVAIYWSHSVQLVLLAGLTLLVWKLGGRTLGDLGLTSPTNIAAGCALAAALLLVYGVDAWRKLRPERIAATRERWQRETPFMPTKRREVAHSLSMVTSAAVCEEIVYRGFLIAYISYFTGANPGGLTVAVVLAAVAFSIPHLYQGGERGSIKILLGAATFGAIVVVTGSLWIAIGIHFLIDLSGMMLGPRLLGDG